MTKRRYGIVRLFSGLFQGIVEKDNFCFVCRKSPYNAMMDAKEYSERLNAEQVG